MITHQIGIYPNLQAVVSVPNDAPIRDHASDCERSELTPYIVHDRKRYQPVQVHLIERDPSLLSMLSMPLDDRSTSDYVLTYMKFLLTYYIIHVTQ